MPEDFDVTIKKKQRPDNDLQNQAPLLPQAMQQKYVVENFADRKESILNTDFLSKPVFTTDPTTKKVTVQVVEDSIDKLLRAHAIATQGGIAQKYPKREQGFWRLIGMIKFAARNMKPDNPYIWQLYDIIVIQYFSRYNLSLDIVDTRPGPVIAMAPTMPGMLPGMPMNYNQQGDAMTQPLPQQPEQKKPPEAQQ